MKDVLIELGAASEETKGCVGGIFEQTTGLVEYQEKLPNGQCPTP